MNTTESSVVQTTGTTAQNITSTITTMAQMGPTITTMSAHQSLTTPTYSGTFGVPSQPPFMPVAQPYTAPMYTLGMMASTFENCDGNAIRTYFDKLELRARLDNIAEADTLNLVKFKLVGEAYEYYKSELSLDSLNYQEFKQKLIKRFSKLTLPGENQRNLSKCYQRHDESVSSFCTRLKSLGMKVLREDLRSATSGEIEGLRKKNNQLVLSQFKTGLKKELLKDIGVLLLKDEEMDLDKAEELAKWQETTIVLVQGRNFPGTVRNVSNNNCYKCDRPGHVAQDCYSNRQQKNPRDSKCYSCGDPTHWSYNCPNRNAKSKDQVAKPNVSSGAVPKRKDQGDDRKKSLN